MEDEFIMQNEKKDEHSGENDEQVAEEPSYKPEEQVSSEENESSKDIQVSEDVSPEINEEVRSEEINEVDEIVSENNVETVPEISPETSQETVQHVEQEIEEQAQVKEEIQREADVETEPSKENEVTNDYYDAHVSPEQQNRSANVEDEELEELLSAHKASIKVVGTGGGGNNTINRITQVGITGVETIAVNTDAQDLLYTTADKKIIIGREKTKGLGAGSNPEIGEEATRESENDIKEALKGSDLVFVTCGLGGGTGTGSAPIIAEISRKLGSLTVAIVTIPFTMEGKRRYENALMGLEKLENIVDTLIVIPNDKLLELAPDLPLHTAFKVADEILTNAVKGIAELITTAGLVNLDFADIKAIMGDGGVALIGVGESDTDNRALESVEKAISNPLLDVDISGANGALINISGGPNMTLEEAKIVVEAISEKLDDNARIIWGAQIQEDLEDTLKTMLIVTGVKSSQIFGPMRTITKTNMMQMESDLGIEFVE